MCLGVLHYSKSFKAVCLSWGVLPNFSRNERKHKQGGENRDSAKKISRNRKSRSAAPISRSAISRYGFLGRDLDREISQYRALSRYANFPDGSSTEGQ